MHRIPFEVFPIVPGLIWYTMHALLGWISQTLIRNREYSIVLPEIHDLLELKVMLADTVEAWAHVYEAKGEAKGKAEGEMLLLQKLLTKRFGAIPAPITAQIAGASLQDIER